MPKIGQRKVQRLIAEVSYSREMRQEPKLMVLVDEMLERQRQRLSRRYGRWYALRPVGNAIVADAESWYDNQNARRISQPWELVFIGRGGKR